MLGRTVSLVLLSFLVCAGTARAQQPLLAPPEDVVVIDGSKNPEQVPEWAAWLEAFRFIGAPAEPFEPIPTGIYKAATAEQRALLRKEALAVVAREKAMSDRAIKLLDGVTAENAAERTEQLDAFELERHKISVEARDRLLPALPEAVQTALRAFVDETRKGFKIWVHKSKLAQFRSPE